MAGIRDNYEDILDARRKGFDLSFGVQTLKGVPEYKNVKRQTQKEVKEQILQSQRLKHVIGEVAEKKGVAEDVLYEEAKAILEEMGHNLNMTNVRSLAFLFAKIFKSLLQHVYVNLSGVQKMRSKMKETPVVLLPTHRSYLDFLLMSYIMFHYHLPMPFIAAGADFMHMRMVGELLRMAGAFYMRRSFGSDKLYWAIFTEYVQVNVINSEGPLEFFIEGTRSRTGKFLSPKLGLLAVTLEPYLKGRVSDVTLVPVSISYDRIVEEKLHAQEMLGIPKPKESTSGLVKARSIFQEDFGTITVHFCDPISLRDQMQSLDRSVHNLTPRYLFSVTPDEQRVIEDIAHAVQEVQRSHIVMSPWVLCAACLLQRPNVYNVRELYSQVAWLKNVVVRHGVKVDWPAGGSVQDVIYNSLRVHLTLVKKHKDGRIAFNRSLYAPDARVDTTTVDGVYTQAAVHIGAAMYRNYLTAAMAGQAMISLAFCGLEKCNIDELFNQYQFLVKLFSEEFTSNQRTSRQRFDRVMSKFRSFETVEMRGDEAHITESGEREMAFYMEMMSPFLLAYWVVCRCLLALPCPPQGLPLKQTAKDFQVRIATIIAQGKLHHYEVVSLNLLTNALTSLTQMGVLVHEKSNNGPIISWSKEAVSRVADKISEYIQVPPDVSSFASTADVSLSAKL